MKKYIFTIILLFTCGYVSALELCTPSDEYKVYMKLSEEEKLNYVEPSYCSELLNDDTLSTVTYKSSKVTSASSSDSKYNAMNEGFVTSIKNQYTLGTCWAFSSISAVESNALKNGLGLYDFSEEHMIYSTVSEAYSDAQGKYGKYNANGFSGGKVTYAASYYFNNIGQLLESEMPYTTSAKKITSNEYKKGRSIISLGSFEVSNINDYSVCSIDEISDIKNRIIKYGSVQGSMYYDESLFKDTNLDYYISNTSSSAFPNHGISIIGWDDKISKNNFNASRDGAWIVKNSWGTSWSNDGLFYVSYDDNFICKNVASFYDVSNTKFDNTYTSADMIGDTIIMFNNTFYTSSKFNLKNNAENIKRVSYSVGPNMTYYVYLSRNNDLTNQSSWTLLTYGSANNVGIKSIDLSDIIVDDDFTIIVKYVVSDDKKTSVFTMCNTEEDTSLMDISANTNYYSFNSSKWNDMNSIKIGNDTISCEPNIFVYTNDVSDYYSNITNNISSKNTSIVKVNNNNLIVSMPSKNALTFDELLANLNIKNTNINLLNKSNSSVTSSNKITTDAKIVIDDKTYTIIILGDVTGSGNITLSDVMKAATHVIKGNVITDDAYIKASDVTLDGKLTLSDVMKIANYVIKGGSL